MTERCVTCGEPNDPAYPHFDLECGHVVCSVCFDEFEDEAHLRVCLALVRRLPILAPDARRQLLRHMAAVQREGRRRT